MSTRGTILGLGLALTACGKGNTLMLGGGGRPMKYDTGVDIDRLPDEDTGEDVDTASPDTATSTDDTGTPVIDTGGDTGVVIEGTGYARNDTAYDLLASDQSGAPFSLHALYGTPVVLLIGDLYDTRGTDTLTAMSALVSTHGDKHFVALIGQDESTIYCDQDCAAGVATSYGVSTVLYDTETLGVYTTWAQSNAPRLYLIDSEMLITWVNFGSTSESQLDDKLDDLE